MQPTAIQVAEDLFLAPHKIINGTTIYEQKDVINLLVKYDLPEPDFDGYAKISKRKGSRKMSDKKKLNAVSELIKKTMKDQGLTAEVLAARANKSVSEIYRWRSAHNLTLTTIYEIEAQLNIKIISTQ